MIFVEGRIQTRTWEDKEGVKRYTTEIVASDMKMLDSKGQGRGTESPVEEQFPAGAIPEEDVPF
jgi:single-strand DNA-binding protein